MSRFTYTALSAEPVVADDRVAVTEADDEVDTIVLTAVTDGGAVEAKPKRRSSRRIIAVLLVALVGVGLVVWGSLSQDVAAPLPAREISLDGAQPLVGATGESETPLVDSDGNAMSIDKMEPSSVFIPSIGAYAPIDAVGEFLPTSYAGFDTIRVPRSGRRASWYSGGAPLADIEGNGTTLITNHVTDEYGRWGAFSHLYELSGGERVITKDANGKVAIWQIRKLYTKEHTAFPQEYWCGNGDETRDNPGVKAACKDTANPRQLVLVTCGGLPVNGQYVRNVFAVAIPVPEPKPDVTVTVTSSPSPSPSSTPTPSETPSAVADSDTSTGADAGDDTEVSTGGAVTTGGGSVSGGVRRSGGVGATTGNTVGVAVPVTPNPVQPVVAPVAPAPVYQQPAPEVVQPVAPVAPVQPAPAPAPAPAPVPTPEWDPRADTPTVGLLPNPKPIEIPRPITTSATV